MRYVNTETNTIHTIVDIRNENPNISIPDGVDCTEYGYAFYIEVEKPQVPAWYDLIEGTPVNNTQVWTLSKHSKDRIISSVSTILRGQMDEFAKKRGYDNMLSACSYATSTNATYAAEGQHCVNTRDQQWSTLYALFDQIDSGAIEMPTSVDEFVKLLPTMQWDGVS